MNYCVNLRTRELAFENAKKKNLFCMFKYYFIYFTNLFYNLLYILIFIFTYNLIK